MPERSFGRTVRYRRTKLGLSQAKLGELVGRSATTVRSWERDKSNPSDAKVLSALSAILGVDEQSLFDKAGQRPVEVETSPTIEEALATLSPESSEDAVPDDTEPIPGEEETSDGPAPAPPGDETASDDQALTPPGDEPAPSEQPVEPVDVAAPVVTDPAYAAPPEPYTLTTAIPPLLEPSYMEDRIQRQLYRVRSLATIVLLVALGIAFLWALAEGLDALGAWWDDFFGNLRL